MKLSEGNIVELGGQRFVITHIDRYAHRTISDMPPVREMRLIGVVEGKDDADT